MFSLFHMQLSSSFAGSSICKKLFLFLYRKSTSPSHHRHCDSSTLCILHSAWFHTWLNTAKRDWQELWTVDNMISSLNKWCIKITKILGRHSLVSTTLSRVNTILRGRGCGFTSSLFNVDSCSVSSRTRSAQFECVPVTVCQNFSWEWFKKRATYTLTYTLRTGSVAK